MEQDVENSFPLMCTTCLSTDRNLFAINAIPLIYQMFRIMMYDFAGDRFGDSLDIEQLVCWECLAMLKRFLRFKQQVHTAQDHLRVMALSRTQETFDHNYMSQSLSSLERCSKSDYDKIFFDYATDEWPQHYIALADADAVKNEAYDVAQVVRDSLDIDDNLLQVPGIVLENPMTGVMSHIVVNTNSVVTSDLSVMKGELPRLTISPLSPTKVATSVATVNPKSDSKVTFTTEFMTEEDMLAYREQLKLKPLYASSVYKCELCIIGFYGQQQVEDHFVSAHRSKPEHQPCKICYMYVDDKSVDAHETTHYFRYKCKLCGHDDNTYKTALAHAASHKAQCNSAVIIGDAAKIKKKKIPKDINKKPPPKPGDLRKLLSKTTIEGYQCLECDMFFKTSRARKNHVQRYHREGLQCDHCKKRFVNRTTLATHLRLHEGPLPRSECPICHKMVRVIQLKYHIQRHESKSRHVCVECNKVFSHMATYQAHLKYSRAHAKDNVFKYPCPMCNKGYPTKEQMQDHFNYQHLGKTTHKCPVCSKPIASRANVEKHMMRVHGEKKEKPRNHHCSTCGKAFTDKKALTQHEAVHSRERPLSCDICGQTFKQKASLYTHRKRVHKVFIPKRKVEFMDNAENP